MLFDLHTVQILQEYAADLPLFALHAFQSSTKTCYAGSYLPSLTHLGYILFSQHDYIAALERFDSALLQRRDWTLLRIRARCLQNLNRHEEAIVCLQDSVSVMPMSVEKAVR